MKQRDTTKLFYNKYAYKVIIKNELTSIFGSYNSKDHAKLTLEKLAKDLAQGVTLTIPRWRGDIRVNVNEYHRARDVYDLLQTYPEHRVRAESHYSLTVYTNTVELVDLLETKLAHHVKEIYRPKEGVLEFLTANIETAIIKTPMPYEFRLYFNGTDIDPSFANWLKANTDKSRVGSCTLRNIETGYYANGNYFYIKNEKILTMIRMLVGHNIRKVERLVYIEDIDK